MSVEIKIPWFFPCNSHLIWMFWGKNLEPFWIIIEQRYKALQRSHNNTLWCLHHLLVEKWWFAQGDEKTSYHSRIFTIRMEQTKLHRHWLDTNWIYIDSIVSQGWFSNSSSKVLTLKKYFHAYASFFTTKRSKQNYIAK